MQTKRIILTGDDGYNSIGTRLLIHFLREDFDLTVVGTKDQQSAVGGMLNVRDGCEFGETTVDGIPAFWVDGSPGDAMEFAHVQSSRPFDYVISGINLGENVSTAMVSSGTVCAAVRALALHVAPQAVAISWTTPPGFYFKKHDATEELGEYLNHPGKAAGQILHKVLTDHLYGARMLNINLPKGLPKGAVFTRPSQSVDECYPPITVDRELNRFSYPFVELERESKDMEKDVEAMAAGYISVTPMNADWTDEEIFAKLKAEKIYWRTDD